jgi:hypothetical protein
MEQSILKSTKNILGIVDGDTVFDLVIMTHINTAISTLTQLGVGPAAGYFIDDENDDWEDFVDIAEDPQLNSIKSYIYLKVRQLFDPPSTSYLITAAEKQIEELEYRISVHREETGWVDPNPLDLPEDELTGSGIIDGGDA